MNYLKSLFLSLTIIFSLIIQVQPVFAEDAPSSSEQPATNAAIQTKIDDLKKEIASKAADLKAEMDKKIGNKVFSGKISGISLETITVDAELGSRSISVNEYTLYQDQTTQKSTKGKKALTFEALKTEDTIIALGEVDEKSVMTAKKIIKVDSIKIRSFSYVFGQISKVELKQLTLKNKSGVEQTIGIDSKVIIKNDKETGNAEDLKLTRNVIAVFPKDEATRSSLIYILPAGGIKAASASPSASSR